MDAMYIRKRSSYNGLSIFPVFIVSKEFVRSNEAFDVPGVPGLASHVTIQETGKLDFVGLKNRGNARAVVIDGMEICGATQCRVLGASAVLDPGENTELPSCGTKRDHAAAGAAAFPKYTFPPASHRRMMRLESIEGKNGDELNMKQRRVWEKLRELFRDMEFTEPSMDVDDLYWHLSVPIEDYSWRHRIEPLQTGMLTVLDKDTWFMDLFLNTKLFENFFPSLIKSYAFDAAMRRIKGRKKTVYDRDADFETAQDAFNYMKSVNYKQMAYKGRPLKDSFYFDAKKACGAALINNGQMIHLAAYSKDKPPREY